MRRIIVRLIAAVSVAWYLAGPGTAFAHKIITVGDYDYTLRISWLSEPAFVGEPNAVLVEIADGNTGTLVAAIPKLTASITVGGRKRDLQLYPLDATRPGRFVADVIPTVRGIYTLQLGGYLGADAVKVPVDLDEVEDARPVQFPEQSASALELQTRLAAAESAARWAQAVAVVALGMSGLSLLAQGVATYRDKKWKQGGAD
jgi:hypothetical protein